MLHSFRVALAAVALISSGAFAEATETTTVGYAGDLTAYISAVFRPPIQREGDVPPVGDLVNGAIATAQARAKDVVEGVTKADCLFDSVGYGDDEGNQRILGVFVAKVVTTESKRGDRPHDGLPVATGIACNLFRGDGSLINDWVARRPGNTAYDVFWEDLTNVDRLKICVTAWVEFADGTESRKPTHCKSA